MKTVPRPKVCKEVAPADRNGGRLLRIPTAPPNKKPTLPDARLVKAS